MDNLTPVTLVHFYDTRLHQILCGVRWFDHKSMKHSRSVTCHACVALLGERAGLAGQGAEAPAGNATP